MVCILTSSTLTIGTLSAGITHFEIETFEHRQSDLKDVNHPRNHTSSYGQGTNTAVDDVVAVSLPLTPFLYHQVVTPSCVPQYNPGSSTVLRV